MCSIGEDDFGDEGGVHSMEADVRSSDELYDKELCNKCKTSEAFYKLPFREAECKDCFLHYVRHKFRATLGSSKVLPKNATVLLEFDSSAEAIVLLDMLHHAQTQNTFKRLHCNTTVIFIDNYQLVNGIETDNTEGHREFLRSTGDFLNKYVFECYVMPLVHKEDAESLIFNLKSLTNDYFEKQKCGAKMFIESINGIKSLTSRQDYLKSHYCKLAAVAANHFKCKYSFTADTSITLATNLLAAISLGRGGSAALDVSLVDDRLGAGMQTIRPLRDLNVAEIELYIKAQEIQIPPFKRFGEEMGPSSSLQNLTKSFVENLQQSYSSTISTVFRTGNKIASSKELSLKLNQLRLDTCENGEPSTLLCAFCNSLLDYENSTTLLAIEFSKVVSESGTSSLENSITLHKKAQHNVEGSIGKHPLRKLCQACRNIWMDSTNKKLL